MKNIVIRLVLISFVLVILSGCSSVPPAPSAAPPVKVPTSVAPPVNVTPTVIAPTPTTHAATSSATIAKPTATPSVSAIISQAATKSPDPTVQKAWHLSEIQEWDTYKDLKPPYQISWKGVEGDIISTVTADMPAKPVSSINAKWTLPPKILVSGTEYPMDFSVTAINQHTANLGLEGSITSWMDVFNVLPDGATGARIKIISDDKVPKISWNAADGTVKSGKFTFKAPEYGFADSKNTNKMTLTVLYYSSARLAWRYIYEWTDKDITPVKSGTQSMP
jgi:hypothetical protein